MSDHYDSPTRRSPQRRHRMSSPGRTSSELRRRKSRRRRESLFSNMTNTLVIAGTVLMCLVYLGFLGFSMVRKPKPKASNEATPAPVIDEAAEKAAAEAARVEDELKRIRHDIGNLRLAEEAASKARGFIANKNPVKARKVIDEALARTPDVLELRLLKATLLTEDGFYEEAKNELFEVLAGDPSSDEAKALLAQTLVREGHDEAAIALAKWIIETDTYSIPAHQIAATAYMHSERAALALPYLRKIAQLDPDDTIAQNNLARAQIDVGDYPRASRLLESVLAKDTQNSVTYYNLAACYALQGDAYATLTVLKKAIEKFEPGFVGAWLETDDFRKIHDSEAILQWMQQRGLSRVEAATASSAENLEEKAN